MAHPPEPQEEPWMALLAAALERAVDYRRSLSTRGAAAATSTEAMLAELDTLGPLPLEGRAAADVLHELVERATPGITSMAGPRFFGWVTGGTLPAALAADWMTSAWDQNAGPATGAPAASAFELQALRWVVDLLGLPDSTRGALVSGATMANFAALAGARQRVLDALGWDVEQQGLWGAPPVRVLVGHERHDTIDKVVRLLGFGKRAITCIDSDAQGRMSARALERELAQSSSPVIVCAQAGNVNSGAFDPMRALSDAVEDHRARHSRELAWLHIDGAFGLWARAAASTQALAEGIERADSWATDGHKFLNLPYDSGIVLTRHPQAQRRAMAVYGAYLSSGTSSGLQNPGALVPELSRRARGFVLWAALRQLGRRGLDELVTRSCSLARELAMTLSAVPGLAVVNEVVFNQVVVRPDPPVGVARDTFVRDLVVAIQNEGTCYPTPTVWRGSPGVRFAVSNASTTAADISRSAAAVARIYAALRG